MDFAGKLLDPGDGLLDFIADFRRRGERWISQPIMTDHAIFIRIGDATRFERVHIDQRFLDSRLHFGEELVVHVHPAQINRQADFRELGVVFLKAFPLLQFCVIHNFEFAGKF